MRYIRIINRLRAKRRQNVEQYVKQKSDRILTSFTGVIALNICFHSSKVKCELNTSAARRMLASINVVDVNCLLADGGIYQTRQGSHQSFTCDFRSDTVTVPCEGMRKVGAFEIFKIRLIEQSLKNMNRLSIIRQWLRLSSVTMLWSRTLP